MNAQELLQEISDYCRQTGLAESTFGRRAVNDGKLASRLRHGGRITTETLDRIRAFMTSQPQRRRAARGHRAHRRRDVAADLAAPAATPRAAASRLARSRQPRRRRRQRRRSAAQLPLLRQPAEVSAVRQHLLGKVGGRATASSLELANIHPRPPALRLFDAGVGDGTVLTRVMRSMHDRFPHTPFYVVGKEISLEDVRLTHAEDVGPLHGASGDRAGADQPRLRRRAVARGEIAVAPHPAWSGTRWR